MNTEETNIDYNEEPVSYCANCYSLNIQYEEGIDMDCCKECGCSNILVSDINKWEEMYERRYGHKYTVKNNDPRNSWIFKFSIKDLKSCIYHSIHWKEIIHSIYPKFLGGLGKSDSILMFFDKLVKDNRIDDLKYLLVKRFRNRKKHNNQQLKQKEDGEESN